MGFLNPIKLIANVALAAVTGGASLFATLARQVLSSVGQQVLQLLGNKLGLPQPMIDMAQGNFRAFTGDTASSVKSVSQAVSEYGKAAGASNYEIKQTENRINSLIDNMVSILSKRISNDAKEKAEEKSSGATSKGGNFLDRIAEALGKAMDDQMNRMDKLAGQIKDQSTLNEGTANRIIKDDGGRSQAQFTNGSQKLGSMQAELQSASQQLGLLSSAVSNVLKSVGEAQSTVARKG